MKKSVLFLFWLFFTAALIPQTNINVTLDSANQFYRNGKYSEAAEKYNALIKENRSSALYYNLGNAYYRMGKLGYAILSYEKALLLSPSDEDIKHNLEVSRARILDKEESLPQFFLFAWWESLQSLFTLNGWTLFAFILYILLLSSIALIFLFRNVAVRKYSFYLSIVFGLLTIVAAVNLFAKYNAFKSENYAIVLEPSLSVRSAPEEKGNESFIIHEGLKVKVEDSLEGWFRIKLKDGNSGWVKKNSLGKI